MKCLSDETLRTLIDREATEAERANADRHLKLCTECRGRLERMAHESEEVAGALASLDPQERIDPNRSFQRFQSRLESEGDEAGRRNFLTRIFSLHPLPAWGTVAMAALVIVLLTFAPARSWTQRVLMMLRVEKVTVVPVDVNVNPSRDTRALVQQVISNDVTVTLSAGKPQRVNGASEASQMAGFRVRTFTGLSEAPQIGVVNQQGYIMKLDQSRLQAILNSLGHSSLQIPSSVNDKTIAVNIPKSVFLRYGNCQDWHAGPKAGKQKQSAPSSAAGCILLSEVPSPVVSVPPELDVGRLFEIALQAAGMTLQQAQNFVSTVDWKSTLVVPIPRQASSYTEEQVDGVQGDLIMGHSYHGRPPEYTLIWVKNGIIYSIHGYGQPDQALALGDALS